MPRKKREVAKRKYNTKRTNGRYNASMRLLGDESMKEKILKTQKELKELDIN